MNSIRKGDILKIQCYKHNKKIHREWSEAVVLDIKKDYVMKDETVNALKGVNICFTQPVLWNIKRLSYAPKRN